MTEILTTEQLLQRIKAFKWTREITKIHPHHTNIPDHSYFNGKNGVQLHNNMKNYHVNVRKFNDIAQHLTLLPDGKWIIGRDWNVMPASQLGNNVGSFMVEAIGNFDKGKDKLEGKQLESYIKWCAFCIEFFKLNLSAIQFHREFQNTSCPGTGIDKDWFIGLVEQELNKQKDSDKVSGELWKLEIINKALKEGLITENHNPDEKSDKWFVLQVQLNMLEKIRTVLKEL